MTVMQNPHELRPAREGVTAFDRLIADLAAPPTKRTARLLRADTAKKARKLVEEASEVALDAVTGNLQGMIEESVDLIYHLAVLWRDRGIAPEEIWGEMERRAAMLGIAEKLPKKGRAKKALKPGSLYRDGDRIGPVRLTDARGR